MRRKKKIISLIMASMTTAALLMTSVPLQSVWADEELLGDIMWADEIVREELVLADEENPQEHHIEDNPEEKPAETPDTGFMYVTPTNLSFGTQTIGVGPDSQRIGITNNGFKEHRFNYVLNDSADAFRVSMDTDLVYAPGDTAFMSVAFNPNAAPGDHDATLTIQGIDSTGYIETQSVYLTVKMVSPAPYITNVLVTPQQISATAGATLYFNAAVEGKNNPNIDVTWSVRNQKDASTRVSGSGELILGLNETADELYVTATSVQDPSQSDTAVVKVTKEKFTISTQSTPSNGGTTAGGGTFNKGADVAIYASNSNGFCFEGWYLNGTKVSNNNEYRIRGINANQNYEARFIQNQVYIKVNKNHDEAGKVTDSQSLKLGGSITLNAVPNKGFKFDCWKENDKKVSSSPSFQLGNIMSNRTFTACFSRSEYKVSLSAYPEKTGVVEGSGYYAVGKSAVVKSKAVEGYEFVGWTENGITFSTNDTVTIPKVERDYNFVANYKKKNVKMFTMLSAVTSNDGVILPSGNTQVQQGNSLVYTIAANDGYRIANVAVDGKMVGAVTSFTFNNINADHQIAVAFVPIEKSKDKKTETKKTETKKTETKKENTAKAESKATEAGATTEATKVIDIIPDIAPTEVSANEVYTEIEPDPVVIDFYLPDEGTDEDVLEHTELTGALQALNITEEEAIEKIKSGDSRDIYESALVLGDLKVTINNDYADNYQETMYSSYYNNVSVPNFADVLDNLLTDEQKIKVAKGESQYGINLNILSADDQMDLINKQLIRDKNESNDMAVGTFFDILLMQDFEGVTSMISELPSPMTLVMNIPEKYLSSDRTYSIIRMHREKDGKFSVTELPDEDNNPSTVTFTTDKFSYYGLGFRDNANGVNLKEKAKTGDVRANFVIIVILLVVLAVMSVVILYLLLSIKRARIRRRPR